MLQQHSIVRMRHGDGVMMRVAEMLRDDTIVCVYPAFEETEHQVTLASQDVEIVSLLEQLSEAAIQCKQCGSWPVCDLLRAARNEIERLTGR